MMTEVKIGGSLVVMEASIADIAAIFRDLRDAIFQGKDSTFGAGKLGTLENRWCPSCEEPFRVPLVLSEHRKEFCSASCAAQARAERTK